MSDPVTKFRNFIEGTSISNILFKGWFYRRLATPNTITTSRLMGALLVAYWLYVNTPNKIYFLCFWTLAYLWTSDWWDGWVARLNNLISKFGEWYDRLVDKLIDFIFIPIPYMFNQPMVWVMGVIETLLIVSVFLELRLKVKVSSGWVGKSKTMLRNLAVLVFLDTLDSKYQHPYAPIIGIGLYVTSLLFGLLSLAYHYSILFTRKLKLKRHPFD